MMTLDDRAEFDETHEAASKRYSLIDTMNKRQMFKSQLNDRRHRADEDLLQQSLQSRASARNEVPTKTQKAQELLESKKKMAINLVWNCLGQKAIQQICHATDDEKLGFQLYRSLSLDNKLEYYSYLPDGHVVKKKL